MIEIRLARLGERLIVRNLMELYQHDFSEIDGTDLDSLTSCYAELFGQQGGSGPATVLGMCRVREHKMHRSFCDYPVCRQGDLLADKSVISNAINSSSGYTGFRCVHRD